MEIAAGLHRVKAERQYEQFLAMLAGCEVLGLGQSEALLAARIDGDLHLRGTVVDLNDETKALQEFIARREQRKVLDLMGKLEWDKSFDYKAERSRS